MIVLCSTVGRGYSLNKLFSENGRYSTTNYHNMTGMLFFVVPVK